MVCVKKTFVLFSAVCLLAAFTASTAFAQSTCGHPILAQSEDGLSVLQSIELTPARNGKFGATIVDPLDCSKWMEFNLQSVTFSVFDPDFRQIRSDVSDWDWNESRCMPSDRCSSIVVEGVPVRFEWDATPTSNGFNLTFRHQGDLPPGTSNIVFGFTSFSAETEHPVKYQEVSEYANGLARYRIGSVGCAGTRCNIISDNPSILVSLEVSGSYPGSFLIPFHLRLGRPVDCVHSEWAPWSECTALCNGGMQQRSRTTVQFPVDGGAQCGQVWESRRCNEHMCQECWFGAPHVTIPASSKNDELGVVYTARNGTSDAVHFGLIVYDMQNCSRWAGIKLAGYDDGGVNGQRSYSDFGVSWRCDSPRDCVWEAYMWSHWVVTPQINHGVLEITFDGFFHYRTHQRRVDMALDGDPSFLHQLTLTPTSDPNCFAFTNAGLSHQQLYQCINWQTGGSQDIQVSLALQFPCLHCTSTCDKLDELQNAHTNSVLSLLHLPLFGVHLVDQRDCAIFAQVSIANVYWINSDSVVESRNLTKGSWLCSEVKTQCDWSDGSMSIQWTLSFNNSATGFHVHVQSFSESFRDAQAVTHELAFQSSFPNAVALMPSSDGYRIGDAFITAPNISQSEYIQQNRMNITYRGNENESGFALSSLDMALITPCYDMPQPPGHVNRGNCTHRLPVGSVCNFQLDSGFTLKTGGLQLQCAHNGSHSVLLYDQPATMEASCTSAFATLPGFDQGNCTGMIASGQMCRLALQAGWYLVSGNLQQNCYRGTWTQALPVATQHRCSAPAAPAHAYSGSCISQKSHGETCQFIANPGYMVQSGSLTITCTPTGWTDMPVMMRIPDPFNCVLSEWTNWGACSNSCAGGIQNRTRSVLQPAAWGGTCNGTLTQNQACNTQPCPVDCVLSEWSDWSTCSESCGGGTLQRSRSVVTPDAYGGAPCGHLLQSAICNTQPCPIDCVLSEWSDWGTCSQACGGGSHNRTRAILVTPAFEGQPCGAVIQHAVCNEQACPIVVSSSSSSSSSSTGAGGTESSSSSSTGPGDAESSCSSTGSGGAESSSSSSTGPGFPGTNSSSSSSSTGSSNSTVVFPPVTPISHSRSAWDSFVDSLTSPIVLPMAITAAVLTVGGVSMLAYRAISPSKTTHQKMKDSDKDEVQADVEGMATIKLNILFRELVKERQGANAEAFQLLSKLPDATSD